MLSKNRDRLLEAEVAREFLSTLLSLPKVKRLLSSDHFSVDGTLIDAWASMKSFRPKDGDGEPPTDGGRNGERNFRREKRSMRPMRAQQIPMPNSIAKATVRRAGCATSAMS